jgi:general secretion pathway protein J
MVAKPRAQTGFTLLELLISLVIFALVAAMAYSGLNNVLIARSQTEQKAERLHKLQSAFILMERDIEQTVNRPVRDNYGEESPAMVGNQLGTYLLEFTRTGWRNPLTAPRSNMQRVAYTVEEEQLIRVIWYVLDRPQDVEPYKMVLLDGVKDMVIRYLDDKQEWHNSWPPDSIVSFGQQNQEDQKDKDAPPAGVAVELETKDFGKVERWFHVPG